jgi:iduronate 2-sulfatase
MLKDPKTVGRGWAITQVMRGGGPGRASVTTNVGSDGPRFFGYTLRTPRWRYTEWDEGKRGRELYDHDADPKELTNLANDPAHAKTIAELSEQLREAVKTTFPPSGETPEIQPGLWAPNLTNP